MAYLGESSHWPRVTVMVVGAALALTGASMLWKAIFDKGEPVLVPGRTYKREARVHVKDLASLPPLEEPAP
jgi:hypothetical protein